ncbi:hypothetical protein LYSHEL_25550 [Lysobacter helvus]|uniref:Uncharacterized protein n=2 Tax=Lysobacteraceae TaxID=32033 RepID=A0ABM7Q7X1_9GAMM|nr:hypothetical protein LYSCAS_25550 [Lysobacter caseinilyticus]BCT96684.1 hypothetical protein LYSHEL_25550 [Lysobacter helvus]
MLNIPSNQKIHSVARIELAHTEGKILSEGYEPLYSVFVPVDQMRKLADDLSKAADAVEHHFHGGDETAQ